MELCSDFCALKERLPVSFRDVSLGMVGGREKISARALARALFPREIDGGAALAPTVACGARLMASRFQQQ